MLGQRQNRKRPASDCESLSPSTTHASTLSDAAQDPQPPHHPSSSSIQFASSSSHQLGPIHTSSEPQPRSRKNSNSNVTCHSAAEDTHHHTSKSPRFSISPSTSPGPSIDVNTDPPSTPNAAGDAFQVIVLGSSGGALDRHTSSYLVKSAQTSWKKNCLLAVDAGSLASGILDILENQILLPNVEAKKPQSHFRTLYSNLFSTRTGHTQVHNKHRSTSNDNNNLQQQQHEQHEQYQQKNNYIPQPIFPPEALPHEKPLENTWHIVNNFVASVCVTHPHLDHISGLVINSGNFNVFKPMVVAGLSFTIDSLLSYIFNGVIWPNLTNEGTDPVGLITLTRLKRAKPHLHNDKLPALRYTQPGLATNLTVLPFAVSHGTACQVQGRRRSSVASSISSAPSSFPSPIPSTSSTLPTGTNSNTHPHPSSHHPPTYLSTSYFITDTLTNKTLLIWGDVEPDAVSNNPRNSSVWVHAAHLYNASMLSAIFIECSFPSPHEDALLFGHFSPSHLIHELKYLASLCTKSTDITNTNDSNNEAKLEGLPIIITHIKDEDPLLLAAPKCEPKDTIDKSDEYNEDDNDDNDEFGAIGTNITNNKQSPSYLILKELKTLAKAANLACTFDLAIAGHSFTF